MSADKLLSRLDGVQGKGPRYRAICPAHPSKHKTRSLAVYEAEDGRVLVKCHAGCDVQSIVSAAGIELSDLFPPRVDDDKRAPAVKKPWALRDVVAALKHEAMVSFVLLNDIGEGKVITKSDRDRAKLCAQRAAHLMQELDHAS